MNKERLAGDGLAEQLTDSVMRLIEREWTLLGSDERAGEALKKLRTAYEVVTAELTPYHHPEYGTATYKGEPEEMNLHASMRKDTFPPNVTYALVLRYANGKVEGVDEFLQSADKYEKLALSVPWLNKYIDDNPRVAFSNLVRSQPVVGRQSDASIHGGHEASWTGRPDRAGEDATS